MPSGTVVERGGLRLMTQALVSPADGPLGDSALAVDDGTATILNQNDARPADLDVLRSLVPTTCICCSIPGPSGGRGLMSCPRMRNAALVRRNEQTAWTVRCAT